MRVVLQRVSRASVSIDGEVVAAISAGLCLLVGIDRGDGPRDVVTAVEKIAGLRVFADETGKMNLCVGDVEGEVLLVSQFTLLGELRRGRRPSFSAAAPPGHAEPLLALMVEELASRGIPTSTGQFGASMTVELVNDGPVTLVLDVSDGRVT